MTKQPFLPPAIAGGNKRGVFGVLPTSRDCALGVGQVPCEPDYGNLLAPTCRAPLPFAL